jgi:hypothetical protein
LTTSIITHATHIPGVGDGTYVDETAWIHSAFRCLNPVVP